MSNYAFRIYKEMLIENLKRMMLKVKCIKTDRDKLL